MVVDTSIFRPYQTKAYDKLVKLRRAPLVGPMGSGKTLVALFATETVCPPETRRREVVVIVCPYNAIPTWINHIVKWLGVPREEIAVAQGSPAEKRQITWSMRGNYQFIITTYAAYLRDTKYIPRDLPTILDEPHRVMRKRTQTFQTLKTWTLNSKMVYPVDGTPMRHGPQDFFTYLQLCNRKRFSSYWKYVSTWCHVVDGYFGKEIVGPRNTANFKEEIYLRYCAFMSEQEVAPYLPKKNRVFIPIEPTSFQRRQIKKIYKDMYLEINKDKILVAPNVMTRIMRERQMLVTPKILNEDWEPGAALEALNERLEDLDQPRPVIFTPFTKAIPHIVSFLRENNKSFRKSRKVHTLKGGTNAADLDRIVTEFRDSSDDVMVCSTSFAESFEFPTSGTAFHIGYDWSADVQDQAEDRLRRLISNYEYVSNYYFQHQDTVDGDILEVLRTKDRHVRMVTPQVLVELLEQRLDHA